MRVLLGGALMGAPDFLHATPSRERLSFVVDHGPEQWRPIYRAVRDHRVALAMLEQRAGPFRLPTGKPVIAVACDDTLEPLGPTGFNRKSMRVLARRCGLFVIVSCEPLVPLYIATAAAAVMGKDVLLVETQPRWESDWLDLLKGENGRAGVMVGAVRPPTEARH